MELFSMGETRMTRGSYERFARFKSDVQSILKRHHNGDWGSLDEHDEKVNSDALKNDGRLLSAYKIDDADVWVITEADRSTTTVMLPSEY